MSPRVAATWQFVTAYVKIDPHTRKATSQGDLLAECRREASKSGMLIVRAIERLARVDVEKHTYTPTRPLRETCKQMYLRNERWGAGVETQKNVRGKIGG